MFGGQSLNTADPGITSNSKRSPLTVFFDDPYGAVIKGRIAPDEKCATLAFDEFFHQKGIVTLTSVR